MEAGQEFAGILAALNQVQSEQGRMSAVITGIQTEQQRASIVMVGMQRDLGDVVTEQASQGLVIRGSGNGEKSLVLRMALTEKNVEQARQELLDHRHAVESQVGTISNTLEIIRTSVELQQREQAAQRADGFRQAISWIVALISVVVSGIIALAHR